VRVLTKRRVRGANDRVRLPNVLFGERTTASGYQMPRLVSERPRSVTKRRVRWANDRVRLPNVLFGERTTAYGYQTSCSVSERPRTVTKRPVRWANDRVQLPNAAFGERTTAFGYQTSCSVRERHVRTANDHVLRLQTPSSLLMLIVCPRGRSFAIMMDSSRSGLREIEESLIWQGRCWRVLSDRLQEGER